jgi:CheY-like chemotaxis protein
VLRVSNAGKALMAIVNDLLDFSKLESGQVVILPAPVSPAGLAAETLDLFCAQASAKGLTLNLRCTDDLPEWVSADPDRLRQILLNLVGNAVKFTAAGQVDLKFGWSAAQGLEVQVVDTGPGVGEDQLSRLFQRFSQVDGSSTRRHGGSGLGLAICKGLVEAMGGEIGVHSRLGVGSTFWFRAPAPLAAAPEARGEADDHLPPPGVRVLVVDDHPVNRELTRAILEPLGVEVSEAAGGEEAVELTAREPFDLILMDVRMPGTDGVAAAARIRTGGGPNQAAPILAFSADADVEAHSWTADFDGRLAKPLSAAELLAAVSRWATPPEPGVPPPDAEAA